MKRWNRWHVYSWLKHRFMATGVIPDLDEVQAEFAGLDGEEIREGWEEFIAVIKRGA